MVINEPVGEVIEAAAKQAIWRARNETESAEAAFAQMMVENGELQHALSALLIRCAQREMLWEQKPMG